MPGNFGPVYEVTHTVDADVVDDFDAWLGRHIEEMLELPGIVRASTFAANDDDDGRPRRVSLYYFDSDADLDNYLAGPAAIMRQSADTAFAGRYEVARRTLHETEVIDGELQAAEPCLNCGTPLSGQYCGECGQRARSRLISIWELLQEAFGDLLELDSRLWRTLIPLAMRPGQLTRDYLEGRRARFMPPFRTYLVLSIVFFLIAFFDPQEEFSILFESQPETPQEPAADSSDATQARDEVMNELVEEGILSAEQAGLEQTETGAGEAPDEDDAGDGGLNFSIADGKAKTDTNCDEIDVGDVPDWMATRMTPARLKVVCERVTADDGRAFLGKLLDNVPASLFILLPLMALVLKVLYPLSKRYYVEHLLFVVHLHAFVFLILTLEIAFNRIAGLMNLPQAITGMTIFAVSVYMPIYLYKAMRRVYGQGHILTGSKFLVLLFSYITGLSVIFVLAALFAAFSI